MGSKAGLSACLADNKTGSRQKKRLHVVVEPV